MVEEKSCSSIEDVQIVCAPGNAGGYLYGISIRINTTYRKQINQNMEINNFNHIGPEAVVENLMIHSVSPSARKRVQELYTCNPYDINIKLDMMVNELIKLLKEKNPEIVVIEMTVVPNNTGTQRLLSEIVGVVRGWCMSQKKQVDFIRLRPTEWRKLVRGAEEKVPKSKDDGLKQWDIKKAKELYHFDPIDDNEADGVLLGHAYKQLFEIE